MVSSEPRGDVPGRSESGEVVSPSTPESDGGRAGGLRQRTEGVRRYLAEAEGRYRSLAERRPMLGLPFSFVAVYQRLNCALLAGSLAFRLFMWLLPFALVVAGLLSLVVSDTDWSVSKAVRAAGVSGAASDEVVTALQNGHKSWWIAVGGGLVLLLWTGRSLARALVLMHAHVWQLPPPRQSVGRRVLIGAQLFGVVLVAVAAAAGTSRLHLLGWLVGSAALAVLLTATWLVVSGWMPHRATGWQGLLPGALVVGIGLATLKTVSAVYLPHRIQRASEMYGALGVAGAILLWLFLIGQLVVCAALLNAVYADADLTIRARDRVAALQPRRPH